MNIFTLIFKLVGFFARLRTKNVKSSPLACMTIGGVCLVLFSNPLVGQDIHYSQFYNAPFLINPGLTGVFKEDARFTINYRNQWHSVVDYETFTAAADMKFWPKRPRNGYFSAGLVFNRDQSGLSKLTLVNIGLNGSYTHQLSNTSFLTVGTQGSFNQRNFDIGDLLFDQQYDPGRGTVDPTLANGETSFNERNNFFALNAGINLRIQARNTKALVDQLDKRTKLDVGVGFFNINRPDQAFEKSVLKQVLPSRITPYALGVIQLGEQSNLDIVANGMVQFQQKYREALAMAGLRYHVNRMPGKQFALQAGANYRFFKIGDAITPTFQVFYNSWQLGLSWDINISEFNVATNSNGGPELYIRYAISSIKPPPFRICRLL